MKHHDPAAKQRAVKDPCNAFGGLESQFEETSAHGPSVWHSKIGSVDFHPLHVPQEAGDETTRRVEYLILKRSIMECDPPIHEASISHLLYLITGRKADLIGSVTQIH